MERSAFPVKQFMVVGLLAAIGAVVFAGPSHAGNRYCTYYPEDPNCYDALYGREASDQSSSYQDPQRGLDDEELDGAYGNNYYQAPPRLQVQTVKSCQSVGLALRQFGYRYVRPVECDGRDYKFVAFLGYQRYLVKVNSRNGAIVYEINY